MRAKNHRRSLYLGLYSLVLVCATAQGEVQTDGSVGPTLELTGPNYLITPELGSQAGNNLFHSFQSFHLASSESATFTGPDSLENIISRVTGGEASIIDGLLQSQASNADFYFLNPAGVMFGPNAQVDVPAAFHVSTADALIFPDGQSYSAIDPAASTLSVEAPSGFDFLAPQPAEIILYGSSLSFQPGAETSLSGGDITVIGNGPESQTWMAPGGSLNIAAMGASQGQLSVDGVASVTPAGTLAIDSTQIDLGADGGGSLHIHAGPIAISNSNIWVDNLGSLDSTQGISINAESLNVTTSSIATDVFGDGRGGDIQITTNDFAQLNEGYISSNAYAAGNGGAVSLNTGGNLELLNGSELTSATFANGDSGQVIVNAGGLRMDGNGIETLISARSLPDSTGNAGSVTITVAGLLEILNGGSIDSDTFGDGNGGAVTIETGQLSINGESYEDFTGISALTNYGSGHAGSVTVSVEETLELLNGGKINSSTLFTGNAGAVWVEAGSLHIDNPDSLNQTPSISSNAEEGSSGHAGPVTVKVTDLLEILNGGEISSGTLSSGESGSVSVEAGQLIIDGNGLETGITSGTFGINDTSNAGPVEVDVSGSALITESGFIDSSTSSQGNAGDVNISVGETLEVSNSGFITSITASAGDSGSINIEASKLIIDGNSQPTGILSTAAEGSTGTAGTINIDVSNSAIITNMGIIDSSTFSVGDAGSVIVTVADLLEILDGGGITSITSSAGNSGMITVEAGQLVIDGNDILSGITSSTGAGSSGDAGIVNVSVDNLLSILDGGSITSSTFSSGNAGTVTVNSGELFIDGIGSATLPTSISSNAETNSTGHAGRVIVNTEGLLTILNSGEIASGTFAAGNGGNITVNAGQLYINGNGLGSGILSSTLQDATGNAGSMNVNVDETLYVTNGGLIDSSTLSTGNAGSVSVSANQILIDAEATDNFTGITSVSFLDAGHAGPITISAQDLLAVTSGGTINSSTFAAGNAGSIDIVAGQILIDNSNISSAATETSTGNAGDIAINAGTLGIINSGKISIEAGQTLTEEQLAQIGSGHLAINTQNFYLGSGSIITAESSGNVPASDISITSGRLMVVEDSSGIITAANEGDGGDIDIQGQAILLRDGLITTSVLGIQGDGGDISLQADALAMDTGFIQANTAADDASGGTIQVNTPFLLTHNALPPQVGGDVPQVFEARSGLNVIQAAAPGGESGEINLGSPELDISASVLTLDAETLQKPHLATDPCLAFFGEAPSSLSKGGKGGIPVGLDRPTPVNFTSGNGQTDLVWLSPSGNSVAHQDCR